MLIIGCDYHPSFQQIAFVDTETGEICEKRLEHPQEAEQFYRELHQRGVQAGKNRAVAFHFRRALICHMKNNGSGGKSGSSAESQPMTFCASARYFGYMAIAIP